jgi:hypothetical protein
MWESKVLKARLDLRVCVESRDLKEILVQEDCRGCRVFKDLGER